jgi:hypothetical protein
MNIQCAHDAVVSIKDLKPNPKNPNKHTPEQIKLLAKIMKHQGVRNPIVVSNRSGLMTKGHGRLEAALTNKWTELPVDYQDYASEEDEYADMVADNEIARLAKSDLGQVLKDVLEFGPDFDLDLLGIPDFKLPEDFEPGCDEDEVPEHVEPKTKIGDIYHLGNHRLMCGDSTSIDAVEKLMNGEKADMVFTDPPYGIGYEYKSHQDDDKEANAQLVFDVFALHDCGKVWTPGLMNLSRDIDRFGKTKVAVWYKKFSQAGNGVGGASTWEPVLILNPTNKGLNNDVLTVPTEREQLNGVDLRELHSCPKPVNLYEQLISALSKPSDLLFEPFGGSGTTLLASEKANRKCFMMELDPHYCDVIVARWEKYTGKKAELI